MFPPYSITDAGEPLHTWLGQYPSDPNRKFMQCGFEVCTNPSPSEPCIRGSCLSAVCVEYLHPVLWGVHRDKSFLLGYDCAEEPKRLNQKLKQRVLCNAALLIVGGWLQALTAAMQALQALHESGYVHRLSLIHI